MDIDAKKLRRALKNSGLSNRAINAAWPDWWSDDAEKSPSARAELCFAVARKLGLAPKSLFDEKVEFVWRDRARFKHGTQSPPERDALSSFGVSASRLLLALLDGQPPAQTSAEELRRAILAHTPFITLLDLISTCWALGVPVIHLRIYPLHAKSMSAMIVKSDGRFAILLGRDAEYPAPVAFSVAHEIGHLMLGHLPDGGAIVDLEDPGGHGRDHTDTEESAADAFALKLLTGRSTVDIKIEGDKPSARGLAAAVSAAGPLERIEPGTLALCFAYQTDNWAIGMASMKHIYSEPKPVWKEVNAIAAKQLDWSRISDDNADYVRALLELARV